MGCVSAQIAAQSTQVRVGLRMVCMQKVCDEHLRSELMRQ